MNLLDVFTALTYGELKQLSLGNFCAGENESAPLPENYAQVMSHINLGLTELHKRFWLRTEELYVQQYSHIETYILAWPYAATNTGSPEAYKYILDTVANPFQDNVLKIEECYNEIGELLVMNDDSDDESLFTPTFRSIQVPNPVSANILGVQYRAAHPKIEYTAGMVAADIDIALPRGLLEALLYYIAMRSFSGPQVDDNNNGAVYGKKFEDSCTRYKLEGLNIQPELDNNNFDARGWI
jgi:hypothetical protein